MKAINDKIKELYGSKASFCEKENYPYKDFSRLLKKFERWINKVNSFLKLLDLEIQIAERQKENKTAQTDEVD